MTPHQALGRPRTVRKAHEQVADQLEELVHGGVLRHGQRLPSENALAAEYGVSRATVREALSVLASRDLIRTDRGVQGGSFITLPSVDDVSEMVDRNINLLRIGDHLSLQEFLEAREILEVPAAELAAVRRTPEELETLMKFIPDAGSSYAKPQMLGYNKGFHSMLVEAAHNSLLVVSAQPIFSYLQTNLAQTWTSADFHDAVNTQHRQIASAIADGKPDQAKSLMRDHLKYLRPVYLRAEARAAD